MADHGARQPTVSSVKADDCLVLGHSVAPTGGVVGNMISPLFQPEDRYDVGNTFSLSQHSVTLGVSNQIGVCDVHAALPKQAGIALVYVGENASVHHLVVGRVAVKVVYVLG